MHNAHQHYQPSIVVRMHHLHAASMTALRSLLSMLDDTVCPQLRPERHPSPNSCHRPPHSPGAQWRHGVLPLYAAGRMVESAAASVYTLEEGGKLAGLLVSSEAAGQGGE